MKIKKQRNVKIRTICVGVKMKKCEDMKMVCVDVKLSKCITDTTIRKTLRSDALEVYGYTNRYEFENEYGYR